MTAGRDHDAALDAAVLELASGEHVLVFLPPALWPLDWWLGYRAVLPGLPGCPVVLERAATRVGSGRRHLVRRER